MTPKTVFYQDPLHDDFAGTHIATKALPADFRYVRTNPLWRAAGQTIYRVAQLIAFLFRKVWCCQHFENKDCLRAVRGRGAYVYANHTQGVMDAFLPCQLRFPGQSFIVVGPDALSIPLLQNLVQMLGAIPLGSTMAQSREMTRCVHKRVADGNLVTIYPEAHIWPYYTGIRPFPDHSFGYPARDGAPVYAMTSCYQKRPFGKRPKVITFLDGPFFPDMNLPLPQRKQKLRQQCHDAMVKRAEAYSTYRFYEYKKA